MLKLEELGEIEIITSIIYLIEVDLCFWNCTGIGLVIKMLFWMSVYHTPEHRIKSWLCLWSQLLPGPGWQQRLAWVIDSAIHMGNLTDFPGPSPSHFMHLANKSLSLSFPFCLSENIEQCTYNFINDLVVLSFSSLFRTLLVKGNFIFSQLVLAECVLEKIMPI